MQRHSMRCRAAYFLGPYSSRTGGGAIWLRPLRPFRLQESDQMSLCLITEPSFGLCRIQRPADLKIRRKPPGIVNGKNHTQHYAFVLFRLFHACEDWLKDRLRKFLSTLLSWIDLDAI